MNKKKISLITSAAIGLSAIAAATPLLVTSCSDIKPVESPNTEEITTFADAVKFTNQFFKEKYTFDMLKKDFQNYASDFSSAISSADSSNNIKVTLNINPSLSGDKLNLKVNLKQVVNVDGQKITQTNDIEFTNFKISPVLVKQSDGTFIAKIGFKLEWFSVEGNSYKSLDELKAANSDWESKTIAHEKITTSPAVEDGNRDAWIILDTSIDNNKEYTESEAENPSEAISFFASKYVTVEFKNIK